MNGKVLITGGAGFIGRATASLLLERGWRVTLLDTLDPQVHAAGPPPLPNGARLVEGDVRNVGLVTELLRDADAILHLAARTGVGQSMYALRDYVDTNTGGTAALLEAVARPGGVVRRLVVASSRAIYGEGAFACEACGPAVAAPRRRADLERGRWESRCGACGAEVEPVPTPESKPQAPGSVYAVTKRDQEELCLCVGEAYGIPVLALRYFNVYGAGQALDNPYTGLIPALANRVLSGEAAEVYEDGRPLRDFVHVEDVARANLMALESDAAGLALNIGSGRPVSILEAAETVTTVLGGRLQPAISGRFRQGDVRHCYADPRLARETLGFAAAVDFEEGIGRLGPWLRAEFRADCADRAASELEAHGLLGKAAP